MARERERNIIMDSCICIVEKSKYLSLKLAHGLFEFFITGEIRGFVDTHVLGRFVAITFDIILRLSLNLIVEQNSRDTVDATGTSETCIPIQWLQTTA